MRHYYIWTGALVQKKIGTNGAPWEGCAISSFNTNGVSEGGAPLVYTNGAPLVWCAISVNPIYSPFSSSDMVIINKLIIKMRACIKVIQKFGMTFPKNRTYRVCLEFAETEINQHFGKT